MKKYYFIVFLFLLAFVLGGFSVIRNRKMQKTYPYRDISKEEVGHFIPVGYNILRNENNNYKIIKARLLPGIDQQVILILLQEGIDINSYNEEMAPKIIVLNFNRNTNTWEMLLDVYNFWAVGMSGFQVTDSDKDGIEEINILLTLACGSSCDYHQAVFTVKNNTIVDLMPSNVTSNLSFIRLGDGRYLNLYYNWQKGESHFGCHYFNVDEYIIEESGYKFLKTTRLYNKYSLDNADANGLCEPYNEHKLIQMAGY